MCASAAVCAEDVWCDVAHASAAGHPVCGVPPVCGAAKAKYVTPACREVCAGASGGAVPVAA